MTAYDKATRPRIGRLHPERGQVVTFGEGGALHGVVAGSYGLGDEEYLEVWEHTTDPALQGWNDVLADECTVATKPLCAHCPNGLQAAGGPT